MCSMPSVSFLALSSISGRRCRGWVFTPTRVLRSRLLHGRRYNLTTTSPLRAARPYREWTSPWQCSASPSTPPASSTTAAPVSSQLVSMPSTSFRAGGLPWPGLTHLTRLLVTPAMARGLPGGSGWKRTVRVSGY